MEIFISFVWAGGMAAIWRKAGPFDAIFWPFYFGGYLARVALRNHLSDKSE